MMTNVKRKPAFIEEAELLACSLDENRVELSDASVYVDTTDMLVYQSQVRELAIMGYECDGDLTMWDLLEFYARINPETKLEDLVYDRYVTYCVLLSMVVSGLMTHVLTTETSVYKLHEAVEQFLVDNPDWWVDGSMAEILGVD